MNPIIFIKQLFSDMAHGRSYDQDGNEIRPQEEVYDGPDDWSYDNFLRATDGNPVVSGRADW